MPLLCDNTGDGLRVANIFSTIEIGGNEGDVSKGMKGAEIGERNKIG